MKEYFLILILFLLLSNCQPNNSSNPDTKFTIKGQISNDSNYTILVNYELIFSADRDNTNFQTLGSTFTDDQGFFEITYKRCNVTGLGSEVTLGSNFQFKNLKNLGSPNSNINFTLFPIEIGALKVFLNTIQPLENTHDTLFLGFLRPIPQTYLIDTITKTVNGLHKTYLVNNIPVSSQEIRYGRGSKDFQFDPKTKTFAGNNHKISKVLKEFTEQGKISMDSLTINY